MEQPMIPGKFLKQGFTLVELLIVLLLVALLASIVTPIVTRSVEQAKESALRDNLHTMRKALDDYYADKAYYPKALNSLVSEGYLRNIPADPYTQSKESWLLVYDAEGEGVKNIDSAKVASSIQQ